MAPPIANILHQDTIRRLSGDGAFDRGRRYAAQGRVSDVARRDGAVTAKVRGSSEAYDVRIWIHEGSLAYACNCDQGKEQAFCKHAVAVSLSFVGSNPAPSIGGTGTTPVTPPVEETRPTLSLAPPLAKVQVPAIQPPAVQAPAAEIPHVEPAVAPARDVDPAPRAKTLASPKPGIASSLRALSHEELVMLVLEEALEDDAFRARVLDRLARA